MWDKRIRKIFLMHFGVFTVFHVLLFSRELAPGGVMVRGAPTWLGERLCP